MIHLEQGQTLKSDPTVRVAVPTGDYNEYDLIECYPDGGDPNLPTMMYHAYYIGLGTCVYKQSEELTEDQVSALLANQPADQVINNRKLIDGKRPAAKYEGRIIKRRGRPADLKIRNDIDTKKDTTATTTPPVVQNQNTENATTTPAVTNNNTSTTTPTFTNTETSTTTPAVATTTPSIIDTSTTTPATATSSDPILDTSTTTPTFIGGETVTTTPDFNISSTTDSGVETDSREDIVSPTASSTPVVNEENAQNIEVIPQSNGTENGTSSEIVSFAKSYAKKKIFNKLGL